MAVNRNEGQQRAHSTIDGRGNVVQLPSSGFADVANTAAAALSQIGDRVGALADKAAAIEGQDAGRLAGLDPEFRPTKQLTIRGQAFDQAGLQVYETQTRTRMNADLEAAFDAHQDDPQGLTAKLAEKRAAWLGEALPEVRADLQTSFEAAALSLTRQATRNHVAKVAAEQRAAMELETAETLKGLHQKAFALGLDARADATLDAELARLSGVLGRTDPTGKRLIAPAAAAKFLNSAKEEIATARLKGAFDRLGSIEQKEELLKSFEDDFAKSRGLAKLYDLQGFEAVRGALNADINRARTDRNTMGRAVLAEIKTVADRAAKGYAAPPAEMAALEAKIAAAGDPDLAAGLAEAKDLLAFQTTIRGMTPAELDGVIRSARSQAETGGAPVRAVAHIEMAESLKREMDTALKEDPLGWAERTSAVSQIVPLDFSTSVQTEATMRARIAQAETIADRYGREPVYLRPDEVASLATSIASGGQQGLAAAAAIAAGAGDRTPRIMDQVAKQAPAVAMLGGHVATAGATKVAADAANGLALMKTDGFKSRGPKPAEMRQAAVEVLGTALAGAPRDETAAMTLANAAYEVRALQQGIQTFDAELWKQGLRELMGERDVGGVVYGGVVPAREGWLRDDRQIVLPPHVRQDTWRDVIEMITPEDLDRASLSAPTDANGKAVPLARLRAGTLVPVDGVGRYAVALGDPDTPGDEKWVYAGKPGEPFVLDLNRLAPVLRGRRPDLFLGGE